MKLFVQAVFALVSVIGTPTQSGLGQAASSPREASRRGSPIRILFIGNSYTYVNNLPELVRGLGAGMTPAVAFETKQVTQGGATLGRLWDAGAAVAAIRGERWDYVVLQEQSSLGATMVNGESVISDPNRLFWPAVRKFDQEIRRRGAKTVVLQTWGPPGKLKSSDALAYAYFTIGRELGAVVIPAGLAWQRGLAEKPDLPLFMADGSHPAPAGSYLAALAAIAAILDTVPAALPLTVQGHPTGLDGKPAETLGELAAIDVETWRLFRRVVTAIRVEQRQAGGYLTIARPAMATPPPMPQGRAIPAAGLGGYWTGTLQLFSTSGTSGGQTLTIELGDPKPGAERYSGKVRIELPTPIREDAVEMTVIDNEIRFSIPAPLGEGQTVQFVGVLTAENRLEGRASIVSERLGWNFSGVWTASRRPRD